MVLVHRSATSRHGASDEDHGVPINYVAEGHTQAIEIPNVGGGSGTVARPLAAISLAEA
jgi:hypothetical protein